VEQQLFAGTGAKVFGSGSGAGYKNSYKMLQNPLNFSYLDLKLTLKITIFLAIYFKEPVNDHLYFKNMKIF
jgi:hypothetical protein